jgi:hypothetical protein|tara:strand:- start:522 stop:761 length:240 start_codon:yes stop_codon:yes gene_type:complete
MDKKRRTQIRTDEELMATIDPLFLTSTPMKLSDIARLPKGAKLEYEISWGKRSVPSLIKFSILLMFYKARRVINNFGKN